MSDIKTWQERAEESGDWLAEYAEGMGLRERYMQAEITDLRVALEACATAVVQGCGSFPKETPYGPATCGECVEDESRIAKQVADWRAEIARLNDLVAFATGGRVDERAEFEAAARGIGWPGGAFDVDEAGTYVTRYTEWSWKLWQIRAAKPRQRAEPQSTWQLVPAIPTEEMFLAGMRARHLHESWDAMLAAAPSAPGDGDA